MGFTGNRRFQVVARRTNRQPSRRVADDFEVLKVAVRMAGLTFSSRAGAG